MERLNAIMKTSKDIGVKALEGIIDGIRYDLFFPREIPNTIEPLEGGTMYSGYATANFMNILLGTAIIHSTVSDIDSVLNPIPVMVSFAASFGYTSLVVPAVVDFKKFVADRYSNYIAKSFD